MSKLTSFIWPNQLVTTLLVLFLLINDDLEISLFRERMLSFIKQLV